MDFASTVRAVDRELASERPLVQNNRNIHRRCRIALYSHDTMGLGHMRRNLLIARTLANSDLDPTILLIGGSKELGQFDFPSNVDCVILPSYQKTMFGDYLPRRLDIYGEELSALRSNIIKSSIEAFKPDVFLVDNVPLGAMGELSDSLKYLRRFLGTRCILGLRDIQDDLSVSRVQYYSTTKAYRDYYDSIWVYGDPSVYNIAEECQFSNEIKRKLRYTGYLGHKSRKDDVTYKRDDGSKVNHLCLVGGGQDGADLALSFANATLPSSHTKTILHGPYLPSTVKAQLIDQSKHDLSLCVIDFMSDPSQLLRSSDNVISMGGYNSVVEILSINKRVLIVPRIKPRKEQWIRASRLEELGLVDVMHPGELSSQLLSEWMLSKTEQSVDASDRIDLSGLDNLVKYMSDLARG